MKKIIIFLFLLNFSNVYSAEFKLEKIFDTSLKKYDDRGLEALDLQLKRVQLIGDSADDQLPRVEKKLNEIDTASQQTAKMLEEMASRLKGSLDRIEGFADDLSRQKNAQHDGPRKGSAKPLMALVAALGLVLLFVPRVNLMIDGLFAPQMASAEQFELLRAQPQHGAWFAGPSGESFSAQEGEVLKGSRASLRAMTEDYAVVADENGSLQVLWQKDVPKDQRAGSADVLLEAAKLSAKPLTVSSVPLLERVLGGLEDCGRVYRRVFNQVRAASLAGERPLANFMLRLSADGIVASCLEQDKAKRLKWMEELAVMRVRDTEVEAWFEQMPDWAKVCEELPWATMGRSAGVIPRLYDLADMCSSSATQKICTGSEVWGDSVECDRSRRKRR